MRWFRHLVFAGVYVALAVTVALTLPLSVEGMDRHTGILFGLVILTFGGLLHEFWARQDAQERNDRRLWHLREQQEEVMEMVAALERRLEDGQPLVRGEVQAVLSEARVLEQLAGQLPPLRSAPAEPPPAPRTAAAPARPPLTAMPAPVSSYPPPAADAAAILDQVRDALRTDKVDIFLQPVVSLPQRRHRYYELFSRIRAGEGADGKPLYLLPEQYLGVAAEAGLIATIDNLLLFRCIQLVRETEKRHQNVGFFCNISTATLNDAGFMREFVSYMGQHPDLASKLIFELSQDQLMQGGLFATGFLDGLRRLGFRFSMDQVWRLEMDWSELARHDIRHVKLDAARLLDPDGRFADPRAVRDLRQELDRANIDLIVEKIETDAQLIELLDLYIDFGQGYLFGEPRLAKKQG
ncbi:MULTISPECIES: EAL domain-containing protein [unclassified Azospirillum]|uniref:EAL domain-containing protein n=1 Tax=unclassified Azospirillum TaxID=2630922 RepID=UPI000B670BB6|nr:MULTISPECIES: EAL domain-containing protein [unclassified Azospirillum]SNS56678.1 cyclic-di-GMP phosphodiesterase, flagellum assembly factor TipF [Azospirillum sp. RU38E]SNS76207.1 cyclic-di-GMP phosphodiesterase, flagellum assembly factor TipF [Azospirillum sp. RU37A]